jgi:hypothetical protein
MELETKKEASLGDYITVESVSYLVALFQSHHSPFQTLFLSQFWEGGWMHSVIDYAPHRSWDADGFGTTWKLVLPRRVTDLEKLRSNFWSLVDRQRLGIDQLRDKAGLSICIEEYAFEETQGSPAGCCMKVKNRSSPAKPPLLCWRRAHMPACLP